jgi:phage repressor protein C with HTH and peptisase S24 domain
VDLSRRAPTPPAVLVAKRLDNIPNTEPPRVWILSDNPLYAPYEGTAEEVNIIGRVRWFAREI